MRIAERIRQMATNAQRFTSRQASGARELFLRDRADALTDPRTRQRCDESRPPNPECLLFGIERDELRRSTWRLNSHAPHEEKRATLVFDVAIFVSEIVMRKSSIWFAMRFADRACVVTRNRLAARAAGLI